MDANEAKKLVESHPHWHHKFEIFPGVVTPGGYDPAFLWKKLGIGTDCANKRVLDIGPANGYFTKCLSENGAAVTSVDFRDKADTGFAIMEKLSGRPLDFRKANVYDINVASFGTFDIVLFLGVLYHLADPVRALNVCRQLCSETLFLETWYDKELVPDVAAARYYRADTANNDITNFWRPNRLCVHHMLEDAGFDVVRDDNWGDRILVEARISTPPERRRKMQIAYLG
jgi:tRNA (mo5U34)-methyltransferase